jgi:hypothetical protein
VLIPFHLLQATSPNVGSDYDYANQNYNNEGSASGTMAVPIGNYAPPDPLLSPAPMIVSPNLVGLETDHCRANNFAQSGPIDLVQYTISNKFGAHEPIDLSLHFLVLLGRIERHHPCGSL